uniref:(California timema) hypothetical protein n=1 Tax=Timema californicum TaxID=61474 RepID=A0A7R9P8D7_TIMCA|nr:unnamed protein product [Timema californicum]
MEPKSCARCLLVERQLVRKQEKWLYCGVQQGRKGLYCDQGRKWLYCDVQQGRKWLYCDVQQGRKWLYCDVQQGRKLLYCDVQQGRKWLYCDVQQERKWLYCDVQQGKSGCIGMVCCAADVLEGRGLVQVAITVAELLKFHQPRSPAHSTP